MNNERQKSALGPAVSDGQLLWTSASSMSAFDPGSYAGCPRRWFYKYIEKRPEPFTASTELGKAVHSQIEHYLLTGEDTLGDIARAGREYMPTPFAPTLQIEHQFGPLSSEQLSAHGVPVMGYIDCLYTADDISWAKDWKTTSDIKYAKSGQELLGTIQMLSYGSLLAQRETCAPDVGLSHVYFLTKGRPRAEERRIVKPKAEILSRFAARVAPVIDGMRFAAKQSDAKSVDTNLESCEAYRGCPHRFICPRAGGKTIDMSSLLSKLGKKKLETAAVAPPDAPAPDPTLDAEPVETVAAPPEKAVVKDKPVNVTKPTEPQVTNCGLELFVNCMDAKSPGISVAKYAAQIVKSVCEAFDVSDVRLASGDSPLAYGRWRAAINEAVKASPLPGGRWFLLTHGDELLEQVATGLEAVADVCVRGVR